MLLKLLYVLLTVTTVVGQMQTTSPTTASSQCASRSSPASLTGSGQLSSPNYPLFYYQSYANCNWRITAASSQVVMITFSAFTTESCCDKVSLYDGYDTSSRLIVQLSGGYSTPPTYYSTQRYMFVTFTTDGSYNDPGFLAFYQSLLDGAVRLVGSALPHEGRLEVYHSGQWGTVCDDVFDMNNNGATVACRSLGYGDGRVIGNQFGPGATNQSILLDDVLCTGNETSLINCQHSNIHNCGHSEDVSISCYQETFTTPVNINITVPADVWGIRLVGSTSNLEGRLEVFHNGTWGTVCDDEFDEADAMVACYSLGYGRVGRVSTNSGYYSPTIPIWLHNMRCRGNETTLEQCPHSEWGQHDCSHYEDVYLTCVSAIRLAGSNLPLEGRLEIFYSGSWGTVCNHNFDDVAASVACANLGYDQGGQRLYARSYGSGSGPIWLDDILCTGDEMTLDSCRHTPWTYNHCNHTTDVSIQCFDRASMQNNTIIRLAGNGDPRHGRLEIFYNRTWGTVCDNNFNTTSATVACRTLGFNHGGALLYNFYGPGAGRIWLTDVACTGNERSFVECPHSPWGSEMTFDGDHSHSHRCTHSSDISIACYNETAPVNVSQTVRLAGASQGVTHEGRLEVLVNGTWGTVCHHNFDDADARVACYSLGYGRVGSKLADNRYPGGQGSIALDYLYCYGYESSLLECPHSTSGYLCTHSEDVSVSCYPENVTVIDSVGYRLAGNGSQPRQGRLEVFRSGIWGTVCDDGFDDWDARVACNSLGFRNVGYSLGNFFGPGSGRIWLDDLSCYGYENSLSDCRHSGWGVNNCDHTEDVSIGCYDTQNTNTEVRLIGPRYGQGRLEVRRNGVWGSVCNDAFTDRDAQVACYMLGFGHAGRTMHRQYGSVYNRILLDGINCDGTETTFDECKDAKWDHIDCDTNDEVSISCWETAEPQPPTGKTTIIGLAVVTALLSVTVIVLLVSCCKLRRQNAGFRSNPFSLFTPPTDESSESNNDDEFLLAA